MTPKARIWRTLEDLWYGDLPYWVGLVVAAGIVVVVIMRAEAIQAWLAG